MCARYIDAQLAGDQRGALALVADALASGHTVEALRRDVVQAAQLEIGRLWQENRISIAHEHMATAISQRVLVYLFEQADPAPRVGRSILVACVEGEQHELPARLLADWLEMNGYDVVYLGANVPTTSLRAMLAGARADLVALSVTMSFNLDALRAAVADLRQHAPALPILVGGHALAWSPGLAASLGVEHVTDVGALPAAIDRLLGAGAELRS